MTCGLLAARSQSADRCLLDFLPSASTSCESALAVGSAFNPAILRSHGQLKQRWNHDPFASVVDIMVEAGAAVAKSRAAVSAVVNSLFKGISLN
jgi:hypothetical protein